MSTFGTKEERVCELNWWLGSLECGRGREAKGESEWRSRVGLVVGRRGPVGGGMAVGGIMLR